MDINEASEELGISVRSIFKMLESGRIHGVKRFNKWEFDKAEVERVKREREEGTHSGAIDQSTAIAMRETHQGIIQQRPPGAPPSILDDPIAFDAVAEWRAAQMMSVLERKLFLTLEEAAIYSGLGIGYLRQAVEDGKLSAIPGAGRRGSTIIRRADLETFAANLGKERRARR